MYIGDEKLDALIEHWDGLREGKPAPYRADIRPQNLVPWLGNLSLIQYSPDDERYFVRLMGEHIASALNIDLSLKYLDEFMDQVQRAAFTKLIDAGIQDIKPHYQIVTYTELGYTARQIKRLVLPLLEPNGDCKVALGAVYFNRDSSFPIHLDTMLKAFDAADVTPIHV